MKNNVEKIIKKIKSLYRGYHPYFLEKQDPYLSEKNKRNEDLVPTYGEILPKGVNKLINHLKINKNDVFVDLGCGNGKVVLQFCLQTQVKNCIGIEFSSTRIKQALEIKNKIKEKNRMNYIRGNFLNKKIDFSSGTIFYSASTCFADETMMKIWKKIMQNKNLNAIIVLKDFPSSCDFSRVKGTKELNVGCSWAVSEAKIYYFK